MSKNTIDNIIYINMNYTCNNKCTFCLSNNTNNGFNNRIYLLNDAKKLNIELNNSRIILNGGECTLIDNLNEYISYFKSKGAEVVLYTNGRRLKDKKYTETLLKAGLNRITIPIHGNETTHNVITQTLSYKDTIDGIVNLISFKEYYDFIIETKFILSDEIIESKLNLSDFLIPSVNWDSINTFVISNVVNTTNYIKKNYETERLNLLNAFLSLSDKHLIKIEDFNLCKLNISNPTINENFNTFYFVDNKYVQGNIINYKKHTHCDSRYSHINCSFCNSIMDHYMILAKTKNKWIYIME